MATDVAFVANFHMTKTFHHVARVLKSRGHRVHWFSFSRQWTRWLRQQGVNERAIVSLNFGDVVKDGAHLGPSLLDRVRGSWEPSLLEAIEGDRVLRQRPLEAAVSGLVRASAKFQAELAARNVSAVFGEATWASEVALAYAARTIGVPYLAPHMVRYPTMRFGFFLAPTQATLLDLAGELTGSDEQVVQGSVDEFLAAPQGVGLWAHNRVDMDGFLGDRQLMLEKVALGLWDSSGNPTQMTLVEYLRTKNPVALRRRTESSRRLMASAALKSPSQAPGDYVLMPLQVQPEASVDVLAWAARDQVRNVKRVAEAMAPDGYVGVKEHSHQFGSRSPEDYEAMLESPNVFLIDPAAPSEPWRSAARAVATPTGTMALENALRGGTSVVFTRIFFDHLPNVHAVSLDDFESVRKALHSKSRQSVDEMRCHFEWVVRRSRPGLFSNPRSTPEVLANGNIQALASGFESALVAVE